MKGAHGTGRLIAAIGITGTADRFTAKRNHEVGLIDKLPSRHLDWTEFARPSVIIVFAGVLLINQIIFL